MNSEKIGKFILSLRNDKNLTQEELAELIPIGRGAVSKWERGVNIPDISSLMRLSEIFEVSVNEILSGEKLNKENKKEIDNVTLDLYSKNIKNKKFIRILLFIILIILLAFLTFYFINTYKKIKVYTVTAEGDKVSYFDGVFINTRNKIYFNAGAVDSKEKVANVRVYYIMPDNTEHMIYEVDGDSIFIIDYYGYDEYFDSDNIDYILDNLYVEVTLENSKETLKFNFIEDYVNSDIFFNKYENISDDVEVKKEGKSKELIDFESLIDSKFEKQDDNYIYEVSDDEMYIYIPIAETLYYLTYDNNEPVEDYSYHFEGNSVYYKNNKEGINFLYQNDEVDCMEGNCDNAMEIVNEFYNKLNNLLY